MPQKTEIEYPTVAEGGRMDATKNRNEISNTGRGRQDTWHKKQKSVAKEARMDATKGRNKISNRGRGREDGCHKRQR